MFKIDNNFNQNVEYSIFVNLFFFINVGIGEQ